MVNKCKCYHTQKKLRYTYNQITGSPIPHDIEVGVCWGTKETEECNCGGDETKCNFYPEVRKKAREEQKNNKTKNSDDCLIVTYDYCHSDVPTLCIAREEGDKIRVLNTIQGEQAFGMYFYLTGQAELKEKEVITHADFIRSADDKKLAEILVDIGWDCSFCSEYERLENEPLLRGEKCDDHCVEHCLEWLKKTAKK